MELFAAVVNTYGHVGQEFEDFCAVISEKKPGMNRGRSLVTLLSLLGVYANAEKVLLAHAPSKKRSQREDVIAAIAAKDAAVAAPRESIRPGILQGSKEVKINRTAKKRPELKEPVPPADGGMVTHFRCKECEFTRIKPVFHKNWARHINDYHKEADNTQDDAGDKNDDGNDVEQDGADQTDDVHPEEAAKPQKRYVPKRAEPAAAAPVRRRRDSAGDPGTQKAKKPNGKAACKKKAKPE